MFLLKASAVPYCRALERWLYEGQYVPWIFPECSLSVDAPVEGLRGAVLPRTGTLALRRSICALNIPWKFSERILVVGEDPDIPRNTSKLLLIPAVKLFLRGCVSDEDTHTQSHLVPVLSTTPIDYYYNGGAVRATWQHVVNTEFYSWDTSFGLVNPRLMLARYSCWQVVFCVNLGTFLKCFLQLR
jgi:hypothetical protein